MACKKTKCNAEKVITPTDKTEDTHLEILIK